MIDEVLWLFWMESVVSRTCRYLFQSQLPQQARPSRVAGSSPTLSYPPLSPPHYTLPYLINTSYQNHHHHHHPSHPNVHHLHDPLHNPRNPLHPPPLPHNPDNNNLPFTHHIFKRHNHHTTAAAPLQETRHHRRARRRPRRRPHPLLSAPTLQHARHPPTHARTHAARGRRRGGGVSLRAEPGAGTECGEGLCAGTGEVARGCGTRRDRGEGPGGVCVEGRVCRVAGAVSFWFLCLFGVGSYIMGVGVGCWCWILWGWVCEGAG